MNWKIQHNFLHHTYTNIEGMDEDITGKGVLRFSPHSPQAWYHKYQHFYAWFLYGFMTMLWVTTKDFRQMKRYSDQDFLVKFNTTKRKEFTIMIISKIFYYFYMVFLPLYILDIAWWQVAIGFCTVQFVAGWILAFIFQLAHVVEHAEFPLPNDAGNIENEWAIHQVETTANFATKNKLISWLVGGLNFQIEHHLFPKISHVHYPAISKIIKKTCDEFDVKYIEYKRMRDAVISHTLHLKRMGTA
jgi:linoleoyl-CoA desaturase